LDNHRKIRKLVMKISSGDMHGFGNGTGHRWRTTIRDHKTGDGRNIFSTTAHLRLSPMTYMGLEYHKTADEKFWKVMEVIFLTLF